MRYDPRFHYTAESLSRLLPHQYVVLAHLLVRSQLGRKQERSGGDGMWDWPQEDLKATRQELKDYAKAWKLRKIGSR